MEKDPKKPIVRLRFHRFLRINSDYFLMHLYPADFFYGGEVFLSKKVKVKVKFTLQQAMKAQMGSKGIPLAPSLTSALGGERHASAVLPPGKKPSTDFTGGCVVPRTGLDGCRKSLLHWDPILGPSIP
jgi:hypothetical protein